MSTQQPTEKKHSGFGEKIKGAAHVVHGIGEDIRGSVMGTFETVSGSEEARAKDEDIAAKGKAEIEQGLAQMKGLDAPASTTAAPERESPVQGQTAEQPQEQFAKEAAPETTLAPPPSPVQSRQVGSETGQQDTGGQTNTDDVQQSSQETQDASAAKSSDTENQWPTGEGADAPPMPGGST